MLDFEAHLGAVVCRRVSRVRIDGRDSSHASCTGTLDVDQNLSLRCNEKLLETIGAAV